MSMRNILIGLLVILFAIAGVWWYATKTPAPGAPLPQPQATSTLSYTLTATGDRYHEDSTDLYSIKATYPNLEQQNAMAAVEKVVQGEIDGFKANMAQMIDAAEAARIRQMNRPYSFTIDYKAHAFADLASYEFDLYTDTGGAHPNTTFHTLTLDGEGNVVTLGGLFKADAPYLARISAQSYTRVIDELQTKAGGDITPDMEAEVRTGTAPMADNLKFFYVANDGLHMLFPPYQVAAYAAGSFDVAIPWNALQDLLQPGVAPVATSTTEQ